MSAIKGYRVYANGYYYGFFVTREEAEFCARETVKMFPNAKMKIREGRA